MGLAPQVCRQPCTAYPYRGERSSTTLTGPGTRTRSELSQRPSAPDRAKAEGSPNPHLADVAVQLAEAATGRRTPITAAELAERFEVSVRTAERLLTQARALLGQA
ncbi:HTH domain-containing protein [Streptomyces sp. NPDC020807]|uniref:HTH domain-containing protein n=1 Tax=Streptomyces sp. NPDC020807 TaxID=3155119 RepID=UPI0034019D7D